MLPVAPAAPAIAVIVGTAAVLLCSTPVVLVTADHQRIHIEWSILRASAAMVRVELSIQDSTAADTFVRSGVGNIPTAVA